MNFVSDTEAFCHNLWILIASGRITNCYCSIHIFRRKKQLENLEEKKMRANNIKNIRKFRAKDSSIKTALISYGMWDVFSFGKGQIIEFHFMI